MTGGPGYVLQPTFGFVVGFAAAAWAVAAVTRSAPGAGWAGTLAGLLVGLFVLYGFGVGGLYLNLAVFQGKPQAFAKVVWGMGVYFVFDLIKVGIAAVLAPQVKRAIGSV